MNKMEFKLKNFLYYIMGMISIAFAVTFMLRGNFGLSTWDSLHYSLTYAFGITLGWSTIIVAIIFTLMVIILNKNLKYLAMAIPVFIVGLLIDYVNDDLLLHFSVSSLSGRTGIFLLGLSMLPLGGSFLIISTFPAGVFDEFNIAVMRVLKSDKLVQIRVIMEITAVVIAFIISMLAGEGIGQIGVGTIIFSLTVGTFLKSYLIFFEKIGLYKSNKEN